MTPKTKSLKAQRALELLGLSIKTARKKRRISVVDFAKRMGVSKGTAMNLEKGKEGVSIGTLAMACLVLGEIERMNNFLSDSTDDIGLMLEKDNLPKRIDSPRGANGSDGVDEGKTGSSSDDEGVGF